MGGDEREDVRGATGTTKEARKGGYQTKQCERQMQQKSEKREKIHRWCDVGHEV